LNKKILGLIPARGGSKGVPKKNIKLLNGYPLIWYTHQAAINSKLLYRTIVSTEDSEIKSICLNFEMDVPFDRPKSLATDQTPTIDVVLHALEKMELLGEYYDAVCLLQPTCPIRESDLIEKAISQFYNIDADSLISVKKVPHNYNPHWVFEENIEGLLKISTGENIIIPRRQSLPNAFVRDGEIYLTKTEVIKKQKSLYGEKVSYLLNHKDEIYNIDSMDDWKKVEHLMKSEVE
jgi:CMP-N,N'-diacetyllegionaminic acid synthase